jgi:hypothetical protein
MVYVLFIMDDNWSIPAFRESENTTRTYNLEEVHTWLASLRILKRQTLADIVLSLMLLDNVASECVGWVRQVQNDDVIFTKAFDKHIIFVTLEPMGWIKDIVFEHYRSINKFDITRFFTGINTFACDTYILSYSCLS